MSKLYYDDALAAAYMAREFGIKSQYYDQEAQEFKDERIRTIYESIPYNNQKFYIHPDSYSVFEPMVGDLISWTIGHTKYDKEVIVKSVESNGRHDLDFFASLFEKPEYKYLGVKIIQRNNKPFFTPLEVKDDS